MPQLDAQILAELARAAECLGDNKLLGQVRNLKAVNARIVGNLYRAFENAGADRQLLAAVGSWRDTLEDEEVLALLKQWNAEAKIQARRT
jgi:hypothetical protein